ncbi:hypothetical protein Pse7367_0673 [Thalassoporum mexicanum PCC 7367]|nr:hypothetical protein Pse7367_0673 [Pseudanabaena sp. PCC 7367]
MSIDNNSSYFEFLSPIDQIRQFSQALSQTRINPDKVNYLNINYLLITYLNISMPIELGQGDRSP